jgi:hypothetical protein
LTNTRERTFTVTVPPVAMVRVAPFEFSACL